MASSTWKRTTVAEIYWFKSFLKICRGFEAFEDLGIVNILDIREKRCCHAVGLELPYKEQRWALLLFRPQENYLKKLFLEREVDDN